MKLKTKRALLHLLTAVLCTVICFGLVFSQLSETQAAARSAVSFSGKLTDVTGQVDVESLREKYFDNDIVKENPNNGSEERWVIVAFDEDSVMDLYNATSKEISFDEYVNTAEARTAIAEMEKTHNAFLSRLTSRGIDFEFKYSYTTLTNGVAIKIQRKDYDAIASFRNVSGITYSESYAVPTVAVSNNANVYKTGIYNTDDIDYTGAGMTVAVLDTGLDYTHPAFATMPANKDLIWKQDKISNVLDETEAAEKTPGLSVNQVYYNEKVPFAYDYADDDPDVYPSYSDHGTHVAGIVAGRDENKYVDIEQTETFKGVAPEAQLVICKVFTDDLSSKAIGGADTIDILAALSDCVTLGVDVINMSLGSSCGFTDEGDTEKGEYILTEVYDSIRNAGISLVVAASNDYSSGFGGANGTNLASNPDSGTVGSPSTYNASLSVASINGKEAAYMVANRTSEDDETNVAFITEASDVNGNELDFVGGLLENFSDMVDASGKLTLNYVVVGGVGETAAYNSSVKNALNKGNTIALVKRGDITFAEKVQNAMDNGAIGVIIYNNVSGTIRMSLGEVDNPVPTCSISMDAGKILKDTATRNGGTITISRDYTAGPFMSEFSSWGPTPDLKLKPEITAHGGEIISSVPGGGYNELSGTSMAAPNMAGAVALLRQHLKTTTDLTGSALNARINQLLMSTTTMALNDVGNPYSPRKQGSGLADIVDAINTEAYITVKDENGEVADKTKIELGDDDDKTGKYTLVFTINNLTNKELKYTPNVKVMTETLATDLKTVAEKAYMLDDSKITVSGEGYVSATNVVNVPANGSTEVTIVIELGEAGRNYIEESFENGMYVEGFVRMTPADENAKVEIGVPYLGFYGDWAAAPLFDWSTYEVAEDEADASIEEDDKRKASSAATTPYGLYDDDQYILPLGTYIYAMDEEQTDIYPSMDKAAVSYFDMEGRRTIYEYFMLYAGLLRGAKEVHAEIYDKATGEVIYYEDLKNVRKAFAGGGGNYGSGIYFELNPWEWGLSNNSTYVLNVSGKLDCEGGDTPERNSFTMEFTIDNEAPVIRDYRIRFEPYTTSNKETKYRIWMDVDVYDNQYTSAVLPCYISEIKGKDTLTLFTEYPIPTYSEKATEKTISFEITDYYDDYIKNGEFYIEVEDYAMNHSTYKIELTDGLSYPNEISLVTDNLLKETQDFTEAEYKTYELTLSKNQAYKVLMEALPDSSLAQSLTWTASNENVLVGENEIFAVNDGEAEITLTDVEENIFLKINVTIAGEPLTAPLAEKITFKPVFGADKNLVDIASTNEIELYPNQVVQFEVKADPWYVDLEYTWVSSNENIFTVDETGTVTPKAKGKAKLTVKAKDGVTYPRLQKTITITIRDAYRIISYRLYDYYGGPEVIIPEDKNIMFIDTDAFKNNQEITKVVLPSTVLQIAEEAFMNCTNLKEVYIPAECTIINRNAFDGCINLEKVEFGKYTDEFSGGTSNGAITLSSSVFYGCSSLSEIVNSKRITTLNSFAFYGCKSLTEIDLSELRVVGNYVFSDCTSLKTVITDENTPIGEYMFRNCTSLDSFEVKTDRINKGAFSHCSSLKDVTFTAPEIRLFGESAFAYTGITEFTLPAGNYEIGAMAFERCSNLEKINVGENANVTFTSKTPFANCKNFKTITSSNENYVVENNVLYNEDKTAILLIPNVIEEDIVIADGVVELGANAFAYREFENGTINLNNVNKIGEYAFANSNLVSIDLANITEIADGVFYNCTDLTKLGDTSGITAIGEYAFYNLSSANRLEFENLTEIGAHAFDHAAITRIEAKKVQIIGERAFAYSALTSKVQFPEATTIGERAFENVNSMVEIVLGAVTEMGSHAFYSSIPYSESGYETSKLAAVTFSEGTTVIGDYAFYSDFTNNKESMPYRQITSITLPDSVKTIGEYAFYLSRFTSINLSGVEEIGDYAFYYIDTLKTVDLSSVQKIGLAAFAYTSITKADLSSVKEIGDAAFASSKLTNLAIGPDYEKIGTEAFLNTALTSVTIPNLTELSYKDEWWEVNDNGKDELKTGKKASKLSSGIFASIDILTKINVEGEGKLKSIDGVLYAEMSEGLVLIQYPAGKSGDVYTVAANTVRIYPEAFYNTVNLRKVIIPYTVKSIGNFAFFNKNEANTIKEFVFEGVTAPVLETSYNENAIKKVDGVYTDVSGAWSYGLFYANFAGDVFEALDPETQTIIEDGKDFGLTATYPENGVGYKTPVWTAYFKTVNTSAYAAENITKQTIEAIAEMPSVAQITAELNGKNNSEKEAYILSVSENYAQVARGLYNQILTDPQREFVTEYSKLLDVEEKIRSVKAEIGKPAVLETLTIVTRPTKTEYVSGETFDGTGMVIKAIYDDTSEVIVSDYTVDQPTLVKPEGFDTVVELNIYYLGKSCTLKVNVLENPDEGNNSSSDSGDTSSSSTPVTSTGNSSSSDDDDGSLALVVGLVCAGIVVVAGVVIVIFFVLKKKNVNANVEQVSADGDKDEE